MQSFDLSFHWAVYAARAVAELVVAAGAQISVAVAEAAVAVIQPIVGNQDIKQFRFFFYKRRKIQLIHF